MLETQAKMNSEINTSSLGMVKTTVIQTRSPQAKEKKVPQSRGKTYTKVTVGKERLIGEKRYIIRQDGTKEILTENYQYTDPVRQISDFESTRENLIHQEQNLLTPEVESTAQKFQRLFPDHNQGLANRHIETKLIDESKFYDTSYPKYNFVADTSIDGFASKISKAEDLYRDTGLLSNPNNFN